MPQQKVKTISKTKKGSEETGSKKKKNDFMNFLVIHKVSNVPKMDTFGHADPYVRVLNYAGSEVYRTQTKKKCAEAIFEERIPLLEATTSVKLLVVDEDLVNDEDIGEVIISVTGPTSEPVTVAVSGKEAGRCTLTYSILPVMGAASSARQQPSSTAGGVGQLLKKSEMLQNARIAPPERAVFGISWDDRTTVDVDFVCVAMDSSGLILDVCFFNNMSALNNALTHGGDRRDGAASGLDETITVNASFLPPHAAVLFFCIQCASQDFSACSNLNVHVLGSGGATALAPPSAVTQYLANGTFAILGAARCVGPAAWSFDVEVASYGAPCRSFMDAYPILCASLNIDPVMAKELAGAQPKFSLTKGQSLAIPVGLTQVTFGLGWDSRCDVDSSCIGLNRDGTLAFRVYYGDLNYHNVVCHTGDNTSGVGAGDDERITVRLGEIPSCVVSLFFTVNVFSGGKSFKDVQGEYCRLLDTSTSAAGVELVKFHTLDSGDYNGVVLVALHRVKHFPQQWKFIAVDLHCAGSTSRELVDECQALQREVSSELP
jgi:stress response protein SCP2